MVLIYDEVTEAIIIKGADVIGGEMQSGAKIYCKLEKVPVPVNFINAIYS
jgi:hypothetical protein